MWGEGAGNQHRTSHPRAGTTVGRQARKCPGGCPAVSLLMHQGLISPNNKARKEATVPFYRGEDCRPERSGDLPKITQQGWDLNLYLADSKVLAFRVWRKGNPPTLLVRM